MSKTEVVQEILQKYGAKEIKREKVQEKERLWYEIDPKYLKPILMEIISRIDYPHLSTIIGEDRGDAICLMYPLEVSDREKSPEDNLYLILSIELPKDKLVAPGIHDLLPTAWIYQAEVQEILGISFEGFEKHGNYYVPDVMPAGIIMRKDRQDEVEKYVNRAPHPAEGKENE